LATPAPPQLPAPLPRPFTSLVAREQELAHVQALLRGKTRLLTLTGPGGVGKTRLAIEVASQVADDFRDATVFVNLAPLTRPSLLIDAIATALGLRDLGAETLQERVVATLHQRNMLLVLDNFESIITAGPQLLELLAACPEITLLVTSRARLRISAEREFLVAPLSLDADTNDSSSDIPPAVRLFLERTQAIRPEFHLTEETLPAVRAIVSRVDGLPLAIELAAARTKVLSPVDLLQRMDRRLPVLRGGPRDLPLRQQTMRDTIAWSYDLLDTTEQALFRRLSVFAGGFTLNAAEAINRSAQEPVVDDVRPNPYATLDGIAALVDHSLLQRALAPANELRYAMLETVREYARERLEAAGESDAIDTRHAEYFLALAEVSGEGAGGASLGSGTSNAVWRTRLRLTGGRQQAVWLNQLEADHDNLRAALDVFARRDDPTLLLRLASSLSIFWLFRGPYEEGRSWLEHALAQTDAAETLLQRDALYGLGLLAVSQDDAARAEACFSDSLTLARIHDDAAGVAFAWIGLGLVAMERGSFGQAAACLHSALAGAQTIEDQTLGSFCSGLSLSYLGAMAYAQHDLPQAATCFADALVKQRRIEDSWGMGSTLIRWGYAAGDLGDLKLAGTLFTEGLTILAEISDRRLIALALDGIAGLAASGRTELATRLFGAAAAMRRASGLPVDPACRTIHDRDLAAARERLGESVFAGIMEAGGKLPLADAVNEATTLVALVSSDPPGSASSTRPAGDGGLTPREVEILRLLARGMSDREVAVTLFLSPRTVGWHITHLLTKLDVPTRTAAAAEAIRRGLA
jgi:predicted ATPase/DNA-binding CsgD family transcriptional regulator